MLIERQTESKNCNRVDEIGASKPTKNTHTHPIYLFIGKRQVEGTQE